LPFAITTGGNINKKANPSALIANLFITMSPLVSITFDVNKKGRPPGHPDETASNGLVSPAFALSS